MQVKILSGISGSGKTTYAHKLAAEFLDANPGLNSDSVCIVSADDYFTAYGGEYKFDPSHLRAAHGTSFRSFIDALQRECLLVIVDNTNTTTEEISPYVLGASAFMYDAEVLVFHCKTVQDIEKCHARNAHKVPLTATSAQHKRMNTRCMPWWWKIRYMPVV